MSIIGLHSTLPPFHRESMSNNDVLLQDAAWRVPKNVRIEKEAMNVIWSGHIYTYTHICTLVVEDWGKIVLLTRWRGFGWLLFSPAFVRGEMGIRLPPSLTGRENSKVFEVLRRCRSCRRFENCGGQPSQWQDFSLSSSFSINFHINRRFEKGTEQWQQQQQQRTANAGPAAESRAPGRVSCFEQRRKKGKSERHLAGLLSALRSQRNTPQ